MTCHPPLNREDSVGKKKKHNRPSADSPRSVHLDELAERLLSPEMLRGVEQLQVKEKKVRAKVELGPNHVEVDVTTRNAEKFVALARKLVVSALLAVTGWTWGYIQALETTEEVNMERCESPP